MIKKNVRLTINTVMPPLNKVVLAVDSAAPISAICLAIFLVIFLAADALVNVSYAVKTYVTT